MSFAHDLLTILPVTRKHFFKTLVISRKSKEMLPQYYIDSNDFSECKSVNKQECVTSHKRVNCVCNKGIYKGYSTFQLQNYLKTSFCQHYMSIEDTLFCSEPH